MTTQQLDRIITIQQRTVARDSYGGEIVTWVDLAMVWCAIMRSSTFERFVESSNIEQSAQLQFFRIRWRDDIDETMRLLYDGHEWDIEGIVEVGRRRHLDVVARRR